MLELAFSIFVLYMRLSGMYSPYARSCANPVGRKLVFVRYCRSWCSQYVVNAMCHRRAYL